jgi:predicted RNA-binding protein with PIN domain
VKKKTYLIVDGYNVIFAWDELSELARDNLDAARKRLMDILSNYQGFTACELVLVFDAYRVSGGAGSKFDYNHIHVVYTKENETGDAYIERLSHDIGRNYNVRVVTSDGLIQLSALRSGVLRVSAREFHREVEWTYAQIEQVLRQSNAGAHTQRINEKDLNNGE